ncbi:polysaccharide deacetylase family protein [Dendrosporobacter sp. 1207_IL3150]|uniref:polysaccharide deacetylase family protein n=1 Tax=Dendrosporobacter sp. 1207_IL3150 TaxID=3084054 RepID=UPI002FDB8EB2
MSRLAKMLALGAFFIVAIVSWLFDPVRGVPILAYHMVNEQQEVYSIDTKDFDSQMKYLMDNGYTAISLNEYFQAREGRWQLPKKPIIITFDDGYIDNYQTALPILEKYGLKSTVFVISEAVGQPGYMTWGQIKAMQTRNTEIGSHTVSHVPLAQVDFEEKKRQVSVSKETIERNLGRPIEFLAFPFGSYDTTMPEILKKAGYRGACTGITGLNRNAQEAYTLKRINVPRPKYGLWEFKVRLLRANIYSKLGI